MGWITKLIVLGVVGYGGYAAYDLHRGGYFSLPELPAGAYTVSFKSGLRGIVLDANVPDSSHADRPAIFRRLSDADPERRYLGIPFDVAPWFKDAWSTCEKPTDEEMEQISASMPEETKRELVGARLDALCYIEVDGEERIARGLVYSVPNL